MKIVGLITEYNPFHNGHLYHMQKAKELTGADYVVVVMSGDFVQRGAPAIYHKYTRTHMALLAGADLVLELPSVYATSSAEDFAAGAVALLDRLGVVDSLCFGSECGDIVSLSRVADILLHEPVEYTLHLKDYLKQGCSYPVARQKAMEAAFPEAAHLAHILDTPNNILGIEYLKALKKRGSHITPLAITRMGKGYHDTSVSDIYGSATAIRQALSESAPLESFQGLMPEYIWQLASGQTPIYSDDMSFLLNHTILTHINCQSPLSGFMDISPELESRISNLSLDFCSFEERIAKLKTKQYTYTRISRGLLHLVLNMKKEDLLRYKQEDYVSYARVLGFKQSQTLLLAAIKAHANLPLITKTAAAGRLLTPTGSRMLEQDFYCSHIYKALYQSKTGILFPNEYTQPLVII